MIVMPTPELSTTEAFDEALRAGAVGDEDRRWELISNLHVHGGQKALEVAARWSSHPKPARRRLAADVLSELGRAPDQGAADGPLRESSLALLLTMLPDETDPDVLYPPDQQAHTPGRSKSRSCSGVPDLTTPTETSGHAAAGALAFTDRW
jgi:hypothetical protein